MNRARKLTTAQQIILDNNPHLWPASVLDDGAYLCLNREARLAPGSAQSHDLEHGPYVLMKNGRLLNVYHHYMRLHNFKFVEARQPPKPEPAPTLPNSTRWPTPSGAGAGPPVNYPRKGPNKMDFTEWTQRIETIRDLFLDDKSTALDAYKALRKIEVTQTHAGRLLRDWKDERTLSAYTIERGKRCPVDCT